MLIKKHYILIIGMLWSSLLLIGQNPFELIHRLDSAELIKTVDHLSDNPFEIVRQNDRLPDEIAISTPPKLKNKRKSAIVSSADDHKKRENFLFWIVTSMLILLTLLFTLYNTIVRKVYKAFLNDNFLKLLQREQSGWIGAPMFTLYLLFFINAGIFIFLVNDKFNLINTNSNLLLLLNLTGGVAGIFLLKHIILAFLAWVFPISKVIKHYNFTIIVFSIFIGFILIPFNIFIAFSLSPLAEYLIYAAFGIILLIYSFRTLRGLLISSSYISLHKFHFFMYLCTVEIAPVIVLLRLVL